MNMANFFQENCGSLSNTTVSDTLYLVNGVFKAFVTLPVVVLAMLSTAIKLL